MTASALPEIRVSLDIGCRRHPVALALGLSDCPWGKSCSCMYMQFLWRIVYLS